MIVGCYSMDLYCDTPDCPDRSHRISSVQGQFTGRYERDCIRDARKVGWSFTLDHKAYCPTCTRAEDGKKPK